MRLIGKALLTSVIVAAATSAVHANLVTGFEAPTYTTGTIVKQNGWTDNAASGGPDSLFQITTSHPDSGSQALAIADGSYSSGGNSYGPELFSPNTGTGTTSTTTSFNFDFSGGVQSSTPGASATHAVYLVTNASADVSKYGLNGLNDYVGGVNFQPDGHILVEEYTSDFGGYMSPTDTGVIWAPNTYNSFSIVVNIAANDMKYFYNGNMIADTQMDVAGGYESAVNYVAFLDDTSTAPGELATYDNLSVTAAPEPASLAAISLGALLLGRRRRN